MSKGMLLRRDGTSKRATAYRLAGVDGKFLQAAHDARALVHLHAKVGSFDLEQASVACSTVARASSAIAFMIKLGELVPCARMYGEPWRYRVVPPK